MAGRPSLGSSTKSKIVSVRLTEEEVQDLTKAYGSAGKALRMLVNKDRFKRNGTINAPRK